VVTPGKTQSEEEQRLKKLVSKGLVMVAGFLTVPGPSDFDQQLAEIPYAKEREADPRLQRIRKFMQAFGAPASRYAHDFVLAADRNNLDWRLLPSISILESGGGKNCKNNNIFGWQNCDRKFPSVQYGIHMVAKRLGNSDLYRDKDLDSLLATYNPREDYGSRVKNMMEQLGPEELIPQLAIP
jgi:hypothetical protein